MKPLTEATRQLLAPLRGLDERDRLHLSIDKKDADYFIAEIFQVKKTNVISSPEYVLGRIVDAGKRVAADSFPDGRESVDILPKLREAWSLARNRNTKSALSFLVAAHDEIKDHTSRHFVAEAINALRAEPSEKRVWASYAATRTFIERIPEQKELNSPGPSSLYQLGATDITAEIIKASWPDAQVTFDDDAKIVFDYLLATSLMGDVNAENFAKWRAEKAVPVHNYRLHPKEKLSPYQQVALAGAMQSEGFALLMEQGTGKTAPSVATICNAAAQKIKAHEGPEVYRAIIVAPKNVRGNWLKEIQKFCTEPGTVTVLGGTAIDRVKQVLDAVNHPPECKFMVVVCSYETLSRSWEALKLIPWDLAIIDEAHYQKNIKTQRHKYVMKLRDISAKRLALTGTPITNTPLDLYSIFEFLRKGGSGFVSYKAFKKFHAVEVKEDGFNRLVGVQNVPFLQERLSKNSFIISKAEALPDLPEKVYDVVSVDMTPKQVKLYKEVASALYAELEAAAGGANPQIVANNMLVKLLRLAQITSGFAVTSPVFNEQGELVGAKEVHEVDTVNPKIDALLELAAEKTPQQKTIVWATFVHDIHKITQALAGAGHKVVQFYGDTSDADRIEAERLFNTDPTCRWLVGNPGAGGTGLNLLGFDPENPEAYGTNCDHVIYYSQDWSMPKRAQSEDRAHRRGTRKNVRYTDICVFGSIDEQIRKRVTEKRMTALEVSDIRSILNEAMTGNFND